MLFEDAHAKDAQKIKEEFSKYFHNNYIVIKETHMPLWNILLIPSPNRE